MPTYQCQLCLYQHTHTAEIQPYYLLLSHVIRECPAAAMTDWVDWAPNSNLYYASLNMAYYARCLRHDQNAHGDWLYDHLVLHKVTAVHVLELTDMPIRFEPLELFQKTQQAEQD